MHIASEAALLFREAPGEQLHKHCNYLFAAILRRTSTNLQHNKSKLQPTEWSCFKSLIKFQECEDLGGLCMTQDDFDMIGKKNKTTSC